MSKRIDQALVNCLATIEYVNELQAELYNVSRFLQDGNRIPHNMKDMFDSACTTLNNLLINNKTEAYESYFMFAMVGNDEERQKAIELAYNRFMQSSHNIAKYLNHNLVPPARWDSKITDELREEVRNKIENKDKQT